MSSTIVLDSGRKFHDQLVSSRASLRATLFRIIARRVGKLHTGLAIWTYSSICGLRRIGRTPIGRRDNGWESRPIFRIMVYGFADVHPSIVDLDTSRMHETCFEESSPVPRS